MSPIDPDQHAAELREHYGLTCPPRWGTPRDFTRKTYGGKVAKVAKALGTPLMPWQRYTVDTALEIDPETGVLAYRGVDLTVPRQSGKTSVILPVAVHRAMAWQRQRILYGAQTGTAAREKWEDEHVPMIGECRAFKGRYRIRKANGREAILWKNGSIHGLTTNTEKAAHGKTLDLALLDEYFAQVDYRLDQATGPAMITRSGAQKWRLSTAGTSRSIPFNAMRKRGRQQVESGRRGTVAFFDWCALGGVDRADPAVWRACMPALCPAPVRGMCRCSPHWRHTVTETAIRAELEDKADEPEEFDRAYLNISRDDGDANVDPNVPTLEEWGLLDDDQAERGDVVAIAVDITPLRDSVTITAVGYTPEGVPCIVVLDHGPLGGWLMDRIVELHIKLNPVAWAIDEKSQASTLIQPMHRAGIIRQEQPTPKRGQVWVPTVPQLGTACANFTDAVRQAGVVHLGQEEMTIAIEGAKTRPLGDGTYAWGRKIASANISPLYTGTLGLEALERFADLAKPAVTVAAARTTPAPTGDMYRPTGRLSI